jgi:hypothetical protein
MVSENVNRIYDPGIPTLVSVLDPVELSKHLRPVLPFKWGKLLEVSNRVLKHHPGKRCAFEIKLQTEGGGHELIGKVYSKDRPHVHAVMQSLMRSGFDAKNEFSIPQPLAYIQPLCLLVYEKIEGSRAHEFFVEAEERERAVAAERCARWLAQFHALAPKIGPVCNVNDHLVHMERWTRRIAKEGEPVAGKAARLLARMETAGSKLTGGEVSAGHGSFGPSQIILAPRRTVTFDWDGYDVANRSRDVARFIIALRRLALGRLRSIRALDAAGEIFLRTYANASPSGASTGLPFYQAAVCLQLAKYNISHRVSHWREKIEATMP